jgi:hypothetical protein
VIALQTGHLGQNRSGEIQKSFPGKVLHGQHWRCVSVPLAPTRHKASYW